MPPPSSDPQSHAKLSESARQPSGPFPNGPPTHLLIVCAHGIWQGRPRDSPLSPTHWLLQRFQSGEEACFVAHVDAGCRELLAQRGDAYLVFSGGPTRTETRLSEGRSYLNLARALYPEVSADRLPGSGSDWGNLIAAEEEALDSLQNVQFSVRKFRQRYGRLPRIVTVISHDFKRARFEDLHFPTLQSLPEFAGSAGDGEIGEWRFVGRDPTYMEDDPDGDRAREVREGERKRGYEAWKADPLGTGELLSAKRKARDIWGVQSHD
jgi:folylpolyglutamate synthase